MTGVGNSGRPKRACDRRELSTCPHAKITSAQCFQTCNTLWSYSRRTAKFSVSIRKSPRSPNAWRPSNRNSPEPKPQLEKAKAAAKADETNRKKFECAITDLQGKISKYRDQSLAVKTNDQYKALLHEIQFAEQEISMNEDSILDVMVNADAREHEVKAAERN